MSRLGGDPSLVAIGEHTTCIYLFFIHYGTGTNEVFLVIHANIFEKPAPLNRFIHLSATSQFLLQQIEQIRLSICSRCDQQNFLRVLSNHLRLQLTYPQVVFQQEGRRNSTFSVMPLRPNLWMLFFCAKLWNWSCPETLLQVLTFPDVFARLSDRTELLWSKHMFHNHIRSRQDTHVYQFPLQPHFHTRLPQKIFTLSKMSGLLVFGSEAHQ